MHVPDFPAVHRELTEREILCDFRPDAGIRLGPHYFTTDDELRFAIAQIGEILETGAHERHRGVVAQPLSTAAADRRGPGRPGSRSAFCSVRSGCSPRCTRRRRSCPSSPATFDVSPARAGLTVSALVLALALAAWLWGPLSDRIGRPRSMRLASLLLVGPTLLVALAPTFEVLLAARALQGLCMPGLLVVGAPYVVETLVPRLGARAMGWYVGTLVLGGLVGRVGVALRDRRRRAGGSPARSSTALPLAATFAMRGLPDGARRAAARDRCAGSSRCPSSR